MTIEVYKIDSDVPVPTSALPPIGMLEVGDSILFALSKRRSVATTASRLKREQGKKFKISKQDADTARIWRTE